MFELHAPTSKGAELRRWARLGEYEWPASAVVGRGGLGATVVLLDGREEVIIGDGGLVPVLRSNALEAPAWAD